MKVAVIGVGSMGRNHARVLHDLSGVQLAAVCDRDMAVASEVGARYGVPAFKDYRLMLDEVSPAAVVVAVPTALHCEVAMAAMEAGAHVLVEKPIAACPEDGQAMIETAHRRNKQLMVGHIVRFNPALQQLKQKLQAGELGRIYQILCRRVGPFPPRIRDVGVVIDLAPHDLDLMRFLIGMEPVRVYAEIGHRIHTDYEDLLLGLLRFPEGIIGALEINWLSPIKVREVAVLGERGLFRVDDLTQDLYFYENIYDVENLWPTFQTLRGISEGNMVRYAIQRYEPLKAELQAFIRAIREGTSVPVSGEDGLIALRLAFALVESGRTYQAIEVGHGFD